MSLRARVDDMFRELEGRAIGEQVEIVLSWRASSSSELLAAIVHDPRFETWLRDNKHDVIKHVLERGEKAK